MDAKTEELLKSKYTNGMLIGLVIGTGVVALAALVTYLVAKPKKHTPPAGDGGDMCFCIDSDRPFVYIPYNEYGPLPAECVEKLKTVYADCKPAPMEDL